MAPQQVVACGVAVCVLATAGSVTGPGQAVVTSVRCALTEDARLDRLEHVGNAALEGFASVRGPERISHCTRLPDVAVAYYLHGDPRRPDRWRSEVDRAIEARAASADDAYEVTAGYPVRTPDGYVLPVTVSYAGHPRFHPPG